MNVNERIARALGWLPYRQANPQIDWASMPDYSAGWGWQSPEGKREAFVPDYAHSLDACLPVLADLREKGWQVSLWSSRSAWHVAMLNPKFPKLNPNAEADDLAAALAECIAEALVLAGKEAQGD